MARRIRRLIAVIGSSQTTGNCPIRNADAIVKACEDLGEALATAEWDLVVYAGEAVDANPGFIEPDVVRGYLRGGKPRKGSVLVMYPQQSSQPEFVGQAQHPDAFDFRADLSKDWEPSFYRSLADVQAALIVGGGNSSYSAGLVCLARRVPILAVGAFGGSGQRVVEAITQAGTPLRREDIALMLRPDWTPGSAKALVDSLRPQQVRLDKEREEVQQLLRTRRRSQNAGIALALFIVALLLVPIALSFHQTHGWWQFLLLFCAPLVAGGSGGTIRTLLPRTNEVEVNTLGSAALGAVAGGMSGLLYLSAQLTSATETSLSKLTSRQYQTYALFLVVIGFAAGLALDAVYQKLITVGAADPRDFNAKR